MSELAREKRKEVASNERKEVPYLLVPSKKDKERHLARFLDIFGKLEITMPFGEALQQMPLYSKFMKDMLTMQTNQHLYLNLNYKQLLFFLPMSSKIGHLSNWWGWDSSFSFTLPSSLIHGSRSKVSSSFVTSLIYGNQYFMIQRHFYRIVFIFNG